MAHSRTMDLDLSYGQLSLIEFIYVDDFADFQFTENKIGFDYLAKKVVWCFVG
jgi:hypothetical protein